FSCFFFFQAEDGIRDLIVTGVQTCALPIWEGARHSRRERIVSPALRALVAQHAQANEVPFGLAHALVMIESGYNPRLSHAGAFEIGRASCRERVESAVVEVSRKE